MRVSNSGRRLGPQRCPFARAGGVATPVDARAVRVPDRPQLRPRPTSFMAKRHRRICRTVGGLPHDLPDPFQHRGARVRHRRRPYPCQRRGQAAGHRAGHRQPRAAAGGASGDDVDLRDRPEQSARIEVRPRRLSLRRRGRHGWHHVHRRTLHAGRATDRALHRQHDRRPHLENQSGRRAHDGDEPAAVEPDQCGVRRADPALPMSPLSATRCTR